MRKVKTIYAGLIAAMLAAVLLASVSTSASAATYNWYKGVQRTAEQQQAHLEHWYPHDSALSYFFFCTLGGDCEGSKWR